MKYLFVLDFELALPAHQLCPGEAGSDSTIQPHTATLQDLSVCPLKLLHHAPTPDFWPVI